MNWLVIGKDDVNAVAGGLNRYVFGLAGAMKESGNNVRLYVAGPSTDPLVFRTAVGGTLRRMWAFLIMGYSSPRPVDAINIHFALYGAPFLAGVLVRRALRRLISSVDQAPLRVIYNYHGPWSEESRVATGRSGPAVFLKRALEKFCLRRSDHVVTLSRVFADDAAQRFGVPASSIRILAPGISQQWFVPFAPSDTRADSALELLCVRRLTPRMGHLQLLDALEKLSFQVSSRPVRLTIVGAGPEEPAIANWIAEHERSQDVVMAGRLSDPELIRAMGTGTAAVVPTLELEGFGLVVLEAMAMGLPVLTTGQGGLSEAMGPWAKTSLVFQLDDPCSLREALRLAGEISASEDERAKLVSYAKGFSWLTVAGNLDELVGAAK